MDYKDMLERALDSVEQNIDHEHRFAVPDPQTNKDGSFTVFQNLSEVASRCDRDEKELLTFLQNELATNATTTSGGESRFKGEFSSSDFKQAVELYVEDFVLCQQCQSPDTRYENQSGVEVIRCTACGATNPKPNL
jgi:translation initiation factor 2 subunit 2